MPDTNVNIRILTNRGSNSSNRTLFLVTIHATINAYMARNIHVLDVYGKWNKSVIVLNEMKWKINYHCAVQYLQAYCVLVLRLVCV
jgi:uncharacterized membrane protein